MPRSTWGRLSRTLLHSVIALGCLPVVRLLAAGRQRTVVLALAVAVCVTVVAVLVRRRREERRRAGDEHVERTLMLIYDDWIRMEAAHGQAELERWRRHHRPCVV